MKNHDVMASFFEMLQAVIVQSTPAQVGYLEIYCEEAALGFLSALAVLKENGCTLPLPFAKSPVADVLPTTVADLPAVAVSLDCAELLAELRENSRLLGLADNCQHASSNVRITELLSAISHAQHIARGDAAEIKSLLHQALASLAAAPASAGQ